MERSEQSAGAVSLAFYQAGLIERPSTERPLESEPPLETLRKHKGPNGSDKVNVEPKKASLGPVGGGAMRFGTPHEDKWLAVAEGIETTLSVAIACTLPAWSALSAGGIKRLILPREARMVLICADADANGVGQRAAHDAAQRFITEGRRVRIALPPHIGSDFNDMLTGGDTSAIGGARDVAA